jgi:hypothetical protein
MLQRTTYRVARGVCPAAERAWIDAMFAELEAVDEQQRARWALGAFSIAGSGIRLRAAMVPLSIWVAIVIALQAVGVVLVSAMLITPAKRMAPSAAPIRARS